jgi:hypothetical protein
VKPLLWALVLCTQDIPRPSDVRDVVGVSHVAGKYNFTRKDFLNEGADALLELGTRVIKVWFTPRPQNDYPFNSTWTPPDSLVNLARTPYFRALFARKFTTFILETFAPGRPDHPFLKGLSPKDAAAEEADFYALSRHFMTEYAGTGKTFVLQNWEGDWILTDPKTLREPDPLTVEGMVAWLNARQAGVERARKEVRAEGVRVLHAAEANLVTRSMNGHVTVANSVFPKTRCDLYSYSCWDLPRDDPKKLVEALDYLASKAPDSPFFGDKNIYLGEFGAPENVVGGPEKQRDAVRGSVEAALRWGARYVVYWQLYCNEPVGKPEGRPGNPDCRGFWLLRPDGSRAPVWDYFKDLLSR